MENPSNDLAALKERNQRVELDKAWELSWTRRICIVIITYATAYACLWVIQIPKPGLNALVPTAGFILSTLSLHPIKTIWVEKEKERARE